MAPGAHTRIANAARAEAAPPRAEHETPPGERIERPVRLIGFGDREMRRRAAMQLQASHGNAVVTATVQAQPTPGPAPTPKPGPTPGPVPGPAPMPVPTPTPTTPPPPPPVVLSKPIAVDLRAGSAVTFTSASGPVGPANVQVTGRLGLVGTAAFPSTPPAKDTKAWAKDQLSSAVATALTATAPGGWHPAGSPTTIIFSVGGQALSIALSASADLNRAFHVFARVTGPPAGTPAPTLAFGTTEFTGTGSIDAEVTVTPKKPAAAPADPSIGEDYLAGLTFAGGTGQTGYGKGRSVAVAGDDAVAAIDKLPDKVKGDKLLDTAAKRRQFLAFMRPWFGNDAATLAHFAKIELVDVPTKGYVYLHADAKARLEAVQGEMGADAMPKNSGVAWSFRSAFDFAGAQNHAGMHTLGYAVDYDAYANPMLKDSRLHDLIRTVTGRSHHLELGEYSSRRRLIKKMGDTTAGSDEAAKTKLSASKEVTDFFTLLETEVTALATASTTFKGSLGTSAPKLAELKAKYLAAVKLQDKTAKASAIAAVAVDLPTVLKPWLDMIATRETEAKTQATAMGVTDLGTLGETGDLKKKLDALTAAGKGIGALKAKFDKATKEPKLSKEERKRLVTLAAAIGATFDPATKEADLGTELERLVAAGATAVGPVTADLALYAKKPEAGKASVGDLKALWNSLQRLRAALADPAFVFPEAEGKAGWEVTDPSASQLLEMGYFNLRDEKRKGEAFDLVFMKSMVKHGWELGAAWGTPDPMHFELIVKAPTEK